MLSTRFDEALGLASRLHRSQHRKGTAIPYISHLLAVAGLVIEYGGNEDQAIAALLHDAVEDQGGRETAALIRREFGPQVAEIVLSSSDSDGETKTDWRLRKEAYVAHVAVKDQLTLLVTCCDKIHNAASINEDLRRDGVSTLLRFNGRAEGTLWYYRALADALAVALPGPASARLLREVMEMERLALVSSTG